jgi:hypothetical protein
MKGIECEQGYLSHISCLWNFSTIVAAFDGQIPCESRWNLSSEVQSDTMHTAGTRYNMIVPFDGSEYQDQGAKPASCSRASIQGGYLL